MKITSALALILLPALIGKPAMAGLPRDMLSALGAAPPAGARLDPAIVMTDAAGRPRRLGDILGGRPGFVVFVDYTCNTLCGTDLVLLSAAIEKARLAVTGYRLVVIGIDPKDPPSAARAMEEAEIPPAVRKASVFLMPDEATLARATAALGFRYAYDAATDQFAHPTVVYAIAAGGALRGTLSPFALTTTDLEVALGVGAATGLVDRVRLLCYAYDPETGVYDLRIGLLLQIAGGATLALLCGSIFALLRWRGSVG